MPQKQRPHGIVSNMLDCYNIIASSKSRRDIIFTFELYLELWIKQYKNFLTRTDLVSKNPQRLICHEAKKSNPSTSKEMPYGPGGEAVR